MRKELVWLTFWRKSYLLASIFFFIFLCSEFPTNCSSSGNGNQPSDREEDWARENWRVPKAHRGQHEVGTPEGGTRICDIQKQEDRLVRVNTNSLTNSKSDGGKKIDTKSIFLSFFPPSSYTALKKSCYVKHGVACQVMMSRTLSNEQRAPSIVANVAMQMNAKLGGGLWGCSIPLVRSQKRTKMVSCVS